jgi:hypothetical protein
MLARSETNNSHQCCLNKVKLNAKEEHDVKIIY